MNVYKIEQFSDDLFVYKERTPAGATKILAMKYITFIFLFLCLRSEFCKSQTLNRDSVFNEFEKCIEQYLRKNYIRDSNYICYYGSIYNWGIKVSQFGDGSKYYNDWVSVPDSSDMISQRHIGFFYRKQSFKDFINVMVSQTASGKCKLPVLNGTAFFVNCPGEMWEQFYLDEIIYGDRLYLTPSIEIIKSDNVVKTHKREVLVCEYSKHAGFKLVDKQVVRNSTNCK